MQFKELREKTERVIGDVTEAIKEKEIFGVDEKLSLAKKLLLSLEELASNDIQRRSINRISINIETLSERVDEVLTKREAGKKEDGNIAFKCTWNDKHYREPCSQKAYEFNVVQGRAWCSRKECNCQEYVGSVTLDNHPCYESIALKEMYFAAGWDHKGGKDQPRRMHSARQGRMAVLTTRPPGVKEKGRIIIACLYITKIQDDPGTETKIYADREKSIEVDYDNINIKFWDYYKNANAEEIILWASGLFRYITNDTVLNIIKGIGEKYKNSGKNTKRIVELIKHYEDIIQNTKM